LNASPLFPCDLPNGWSTISWDGASWPGLLGLDAVLLVVRQHHEMLEREVFPAAAAFEAARPEE